MAAASRILLGAKNLEESILCKKEYERTRYAFRKFHTSIPLVKRNSLIIEKNTESY